MKILKFFFGYLFKNIGLILSIVEQIVTIFGQLLKVAGGVVSLTPSRKDDAIVNAIETFFEKKFIPVFKKIKEFLYKIGN